MASPTNAEHYVKACHKCGKPFEKSDQRLIAPKKENRKHFWFLCEECYNADGVWWVGSIPIYEKKGWVKVDELHKQAQPA